MLVLYYCGKGSKRDLQTLQNNALRICLRYRMVDRITIDQLHAEANLQSLEQRRILQLLKLLYDCSKDRTYLKVTANRTRAETKVMSPKNIVRKTRGYSDDGFRGKKERKNYKKNLPGPPPPPANLLFKIHPCMLYSEFSVMAVA